MPKPHRKPRPLLDAEVQAMREERAAGVLVHEIAKFHDRDQAFVSRILTGDFRKRAPGPIASKKRFRLSEEDRMTIMHNISFSQTYFGKAPSTAKLSKKYGVDRRTLESNVLRRAVSWIDSFWLQVDRTQGPNSCFPWKGILLDTGKPVDQRPGRMAEGPRRNHRVHRLAFELSFGPVLKGKRLVHTSPSDGRCPIQLCCNAAHWTPKPAGRRLPLPCRTTGTSCIITKLQ